MNEIESLRKVTNRFPSKRADELSPIWRFGIHVFVRVRVHVTIKTLSVIWFIRSLIKHNLFIRTSHICGPSTAAATITMKSPSLAKWLGMFVDMIDTLCVIRDNAPFYSQNKILSIQKQIIFIQFQIYCSILITCSVHIARLFVRHHIHEHELCICIGCGMCIDRWRTTSYGNFILFFLLFWVCRFARLLRWIEFKTCYRHWRKLASTLSFISLSFYCISPAAATQYTVHTASGHDGLQSNWM